MIRNCSTLDAAYEGELSPEAQSFQALPVSGPIVTAGKLEHYVPHALKVRYMESQRWSS